MGSLYLYILASYKDCCRSLEARWIHINLAGLRNKYQCSHPVCVCMMQGNYCVCGADYAGVDCAESVTGLSVMTSVVPGPRGQWLTRVGHSLVNCASDGAAALLLYVFGGYSVQRGLMNDVWSYNSTSGHWQLMQPVDRYQPAPRSHLFHQPPYLQ